MDEGRLVVVELDQGEGQDDLDARLCLGHGFKAELGLVAGIAAGQLVALAGRQDAGPVKPIGVLPGGKRSAGALAKAAVQRTLVKAIPLQRLLQLLPVGLGQGGLGGSGLGWRFLGQRGVGGRGHAGCHFGGGDGAVGFQPGHRRLDRRRVLTDRPESVGIAGTIRQIAVSRDQVLPPQVQQPRCRRRTRGGAERDAVPAIPQAVAFDIREKCCIGAGAVHGGVQTGLRLDLQPGLVLRHHRHRHQQRPKAEQKTNNFHPKQTFFVPPHRAGAIFAGH